MNYFFKDEKRLVIISLFLSFFMVSQIVLAVESSNTNRVYLEGPISAIAPQSLFTVSVFLNAKDPTNAFDLEITYPQDHLKFLNFDNTDSIVDIWQPKPALVSDGDIKLSGAIIKAFNGSNGLLIKLAFKALNSGKSALSFVKSNLYIADGKGTEIKASAEAVTFSIEENGKVISSPFVPFKSTPSDILIKQELETFKPNVPSNNIFIPLLIIILVVIVIVFCIKKMYNKFKRKL